MKKILLFILIMFGILACHKDLPDPLDPPPIHSFFPEVYVDLKPSVPIDSAFKLIDIVDGQKTVAMEGFLESDLSSDSIESLKDDFYNNYGIRIHSTNSETKKTMVLVYLYGMQKTNKQELWSIFVDKFNIKEGIENAWQMEFTVESGKEDFWMNEFKKFNFVESSYRLGGV